MDDDCKEIFVKDGVFIHTTVVAADEDALVPGRIVIFEKREGMFIAWQNKEKEKHSNDAEWAVVDCVSYKTNHNSDASADNVSLSSSNEKYAEKHKYIVNFNIKDLKCFKRSKPSLGWSYLIFILKCGTTCPALHFHQGGTKALIHELETYLSIKRSATDQCLYLVREQDPAALSKSFDELNLFEEQSSDMISKFMKDPVNATIGSFSKVTKFINDMLTVEAPQQEINFNFLKDDDDDDDDRGIDISDNQELGFEVVTKTELPERPDVKRQLPLSRSQWLKHMDSDGRILNVDALNDVIFRGGIEPSIRSDVWKFMLDYFQWDSSESERKEEKKKKSESYFRMKFQWASISSEQEKRFSQIRDRKNLIDKDVTRTDRSHIYYRGDDNKNITILYDILMTYCMYNFDLGYVQGMSDLLSPILVLMDDEVDAFWCFTGFMELVGKNFTMDQAHMKEQLSQLHTLLKFYDSQLSNHLESHDSGNMYFCFRWLLILFKREFSFYDLNILWEVVWTGKPCQNFHLLFCIAILDTEKNLLIENNFGFTEILKRINDISGNIDLEYSLKKAEGMYLQLKNYKNLPPSIREIFGFDTDKDSMIIDSIPSSPVMMSKFDKRSKKNTLTNSNNENKFNAELLENRQNEFT